MSERMAWRNVPVDATVADRNGQLFKVLNRVNGSIALGRQDRSVITVTPGPDSEVTVVWLPPNPAPDGSAAAAVAMVQRVFPEAEAACARCAAGDTASECECETHCGSPCCVNFRIPLSI